MNWNQAQVWLDGCRRNHDCGTAKTSRLLTRLICLDLAKSGVQPRLCLSNSLPPDSEYCKLSHYWGRVVIKTLQRENIQLFQEEIPADGLTKTFKDVILAASRLGFQYVWIDSLCIIQDNSEDWEREASMMADVYAGSKLNFAATAAKDGRRGMLFKRDQQHYRPCLIKFNSDDIDNYAVVNPNFRMKEVENSQLAERT